MPPGRGVASIRRAAAQVTAATNAAQEAHGSACLPDGGKLENAPEGVLAPDALDEASRLAELIGGHGTRDAEGAMFLATFHLHRWQRLPAGEDAWDAEQMGTWLGIVGAIDPRLVPPPLRSMAARGASAGPDPDIHSLNAEAAMLADRSEQTGETGLLDSAIDLWRVALGQLRPDQLAPAATILINLSGALTTRARIGGSREDADEAVALASVAVEITPPEHQLHATSLAHRGVALKDRFGLSGERADLADALTAARSATADDYQAHPARSKFLANLADMLRINFEIVGLLSDLDDAVVLNLAALSVATSDEATVIQANLCGVFQLRFEQTQERADLDEAVRLGRDAVAATPPAHPDLAGRLYSLSGALQARVRFPDRSGDIAEAVRVARQAVAATTDDHPARGMCLSNLAAALRLQMSIGEILSTAAPGQRDRDLAEAIGSAQAARDSVPTAHPDRARYLNALGILLRMRGSAADLDEAVAAAAGAVAATPAGHYDWCPHMSNLGNALKARFLVSRREEDFAAATSAWKKAANAPSGESQVRLAAAIEWGRLAAAESDAARAAEGFGHAVSLLPIVAWRGLERGAREENLARWGGLAGDAAAWAIRNGEPERAVKILEQGRSVLWTSNFTFGPTWTGWLWSIAI